MSVQQRMRDERGAIATITAILAVALIGFAAFAIDLGNAFARKRIVQTQADLAALAGGGFLPDTSSAATNAAVEEAYQYLIRNTVIGDDPGVTKADFIDGDDANGEIRVLGGGNRLGVLAPPAFVDYGLAQVFNQDGLDVQAYAEVGVFSPGVIAPFFIPYGCSTPLPTDIFVIDDLLWRGYTRSRGSADFGEGLNARTGELEKTIATEKAWAYPTLAHHRCYRSKATSRFILSARSGTEFIDVESGKINPNH